MSATVPPVPPAASKAAKPALVGLVFLGLLQAIQAADPNISSTALLSAGKALDMGTLSALAASISTFVLAASVITTGMLADRLGRRKVLMSALVISAAGDLLAAVAPDTMVYLGGRALAGLGLGAVFGASFAYVKAFASGKGGLPAALGVYMAVGGLFIVVITFVGSSLVGVDWRMAFVVIPVLSLISVPLSLVVLPKDGRRESTTAPWDIVGQLLLALGIIAFLYGVSHATNGIATVLTIVPTLIGIGVLAAFALWERRKGDAGFFPIRLFRNPLFLAAVFAGLVYNLSSGVLLLSFSNLFQYANDLHGLKLSLIQLPYLIAAIVGALVVGRLRGAGRLSVRGTILVGTAITVLGMLLFAATAIARPSNALAFIPALVVVGIGVVIPSIPYGGLILRTADPAHYGAVSSSRTTIGQFWYALGLAGSTVLIDSLTRSAVSSKLGPSAVKELDTWAASGGKPSNPDVLHDAAHAFSSSFAIAMVVFAAIVAIGGIIGWYLLKRHLATDPPASEDIHPPVPTSTASSPAS